MTYTSNQDKDKISIWYLLLPDKLVIVPNSNFKSMKTNPMLYDVNHLINAIILSQTLD